MIVALALAAALQATPARFVSPASPGRAGVAVRIGHDLTVQIPPYDGRELAELARGLASATAPAGARGGFARLDLVLEYARPNRPTFSQLAAEPGLSLTGSVGVGGATVTGEAVRTDGTHLPLRFSWYETDLSQEVGADTWRDADRAFRFLADELARGRAPDRLGPGRLTPQSTGSRVF